MPELIEQARYIFETIRLIQRKLIPHAAAQVAASGSCLDLTIPQLNALHTIRTLKGVSIKELAEGLEVSAPSASAMVERLVEVGAVTREPSPHDRREVVVQLSPLGEQTAEMSERFMLEAISALLQQIGPTHAQMWCEVYEKIREAVGDTDPASIGTPCEEAK
ncbi:MAG: MarR family transcriptional regulator [bacterium]|nr:MarR family transcriptional regulator [bacterium]